MYIVIELQKNGSSVANLVTTHQTINEADNKYYTVLAAAAISSVEQHAVSMLEDTGSCIKSGFYTHGENE